MHEWGDDWFEKNGKDLYAGINLFAHIVRKYGLIKCYNKEKYGTHRTDFVLFWDGGIHYFLCKSFVRICHPFIYWKIDRYFVRPLTKYTGLLWLATRYQEFIWNSAIQIACKKYPNVIDELVMDMYPYMIIKPNMFGDVDGEKIHNKYWKTLS